MAREKLTVLQVEKKRKPGMYGDGGGLWLRVTPQGCKSWIYRYMTAGTAHEMGLGPYPVFSLAEAREKALNARKLRYGGIDPIEQKKDQKTAQRIVEAHTKTFRECAEGYIDTHRPAWKHPKHIAQWESSLATHVYPTFGDLPAAAIDTTLVMKAIEPLWRTKTETASRVRGRIESILDWAKTRGYRNGENPARWKGHLDNLLPKKSKITKVEHFAALPYAEMPAFMAKLREQTGTVARALEFLVLCATRVSDLVGSAREDRKPMRRADIANGTWTIKETKNQSELKVPLAPRCLEILEQVKDDGAVVFPGITNDKLDRFLKRLTTKATVHGMRASFRTWAEEQTSYPSAVYEMALAHTVGSAVERAYQRGELLDKRAALMREWSAFCGTPPAANVVPMRKVIS